MTDDASLRIGVLAGGPSSERDISLASGRAVHDALISQGRDAVFIDIADERLDVLSATLRYEGIDVAFLALHGRFGEDGTVQQFLEQESIPYTGSGPEASRLALDKLASKHVFADAGIATPPYRVVSENEAIEVDDLGLPVVVKPRTEGSSIGLSIVRETGRLKQAVALAARYDATVIVEKYIQGDEITVGILDDEPLCAIQIVPGEEFYNYQAKYESTATRYLVPAPLKQDEYRRCCEFGRRAHYALQCRGFSRVDMIKDASGGIYVLEVNTIPGLTATSLLPKAACYAGISFPELCMRMLASALEPRRCHAKT